MAARKILLVEDDPHVREAVSLLLQRLAYSVCEAGTCAEALALAEAEPPDLILLDLGLPDGDGIEVAQELRRRPATAHIPIAAFTGQRLSGLRAEAVAKMCAGTIPKPATPERLERDVRLLLTVRRVAARRFPRVPLKAPVWWRVRGSGESPEAFSGDGVARTISEEGLTVELPMPLAVASLLDLRLRVPAGEVAAAGKIVWSRSPGEEKTGSGPYQHGVQFVDMAPHQRAAIQYFLKDAGAATAYGGGPY